MSNEGTRNQQEQQQEQHIPDPMLRVVDTEGDETSGQERRELLQTRIDRTEQWTGVFFDQYAAVRPPAPPSLVADSDISPFRLSSGAPSPTCQEEVFESVEYDEEDNEAAMDRRQN